MLVDSWLLVVGHVLTLSGDDHFGLGLANDQNVLGVFQNAGDGRQRVVSRVDLCQGSILQLDAPASLSRHRRASLSLRAFD
ncbi:hypothetical protein EAS61_36275 [Bradyrhizobium zhanjiangense]|uniref:Uncharacterized protein n=1 Tax=Bradyrhizobium zhanjiangense TaxID=1325107 RepID=A0A4Q0Q8V9_9BRAD|nr:hypothetical protein EAS61_36275 [Bradyrhizobium zhanjiangense]